MKISGMIDHLKSIQEFHGDLDVYEYTEYATIAKRENNYLPKVDKIHYKKHEEFESLQDELYNDDASIDDKDIYDIDLSRPIVIGVVI